MCRLGHILFFVEILLGIKSEYLLVYMTIRFGALMFITLLVIIFRFPENRCFFQGIDEAIIRCS